MRELVAGNAMLETAAEPILGARAALRRELAELEKLVRNLARQDRACRLLMTMPGVGHVIALTYTSAIDDPERFHRSKDVGPWVGLTPGREQSGERDIVGRMTKAGDAGLRAALYQAATVMLNRAGPNWLKAWALRLAKHRGKKRATVALARRIGVARAVPAPAAEEGDQSVPRRVQTVAGTVSGGSGIRTARSRKAGMRTGGWRSGSCPGSGRPVWERRYPEPAVPSRRPGTV